MTLNAIAAVCADVGFQGQVRAAAVAYALTVQGSASTAHNRVDTKRWALATAVLNDGCVAKLTAMVWGIANSGAGTFALTDAGNTNDALINSAMVTEWSNMAGVTGADSTN